MTDAEKVRRAVDDGEYVAGVAPLLAAEVRRLRVFEAAMAGMAADAGYEMFSDSPLTLDPAEIVKDYRKSCELHATYDALDAMVKAAEKTRTKYIKGMPA